MRKHRAGDGVRNQCTGELSLAFVEVPLNVKPLRSQKQDPPPTEEDYRTKFYEKYRHEAEEYDREFIKRYDEDLNTTLIFVCFSRSSCLRCADSTYRPVCSPL